MLFVCENNGYAIHEPIEKRRARVDGIGAVAQALGVPAHFVGDGDTLALHAIAEAAVARIRAGGGPEFIEAVVYRWREHVGPNEDYDQGYRPRAEMEPWMVSDQVTKLAELVDLVQRAKIDAEIEREIKAAVEFAENSPEPPANELLADVYA